MSDEDSIPFTRSSVRSLCALGLSKSVSVVSNYVNGGHLSKLAVHATLTARKQDLGCYLKS